MTTKNRKRRVQEARASVGLLEQRKAGLRSALGRFREAGRVLSAENEAKLRAAADNIAAVLAALEKPDDTAEAADAKCPTCEGKGKIREGNVECPDCGGSGKASEVNKEARRSRLLGLAEAYSAAADDAADGAYIISALLDLMSDESDEPGELSILQGAYALLVQWMQLEVASIGSPDDAEDSADGDPMDMFWGWESARKRLKASGGAIAPRDGGPALQQLREAKRLRTDLVPIAEAAVKEDGSGAIKIIEPGWGSSGYYSTEVLERDGAETFPAGTKMFWDHPTLSEEWERPERSLRDLAGELTSDAMWNAAGQAGPGLYANVKVFENFAPAVNELAPSIGVSIRAYGKGSVGEAEGQTGFIIDELVGSESVDFVTFPGAGGQVLQLFEAARQRLGNPAHKEETMDDVEKNPKFMELATRAARAEERVIRTEAKEIVTAKLAEAQLPDITRARLATQLEVNPPAKDGALDRPALEKRIDEAVKAEVEYLAKLTGAGQIKGMGGPGGPGNEDLTPALEAEFRRGGLSESAAKLAAAGRR